MKQNWKTLSSKSIYSDRFFDLIYNEVIRPDGSNGDYAYLRNKGAVVIIPQTEQGKIVLIKEFRYPPQKEFIELPAGHIEPELSVEENAKKELHEETGLTAKEYVPLGEFYAAPSTIQYPIHTFLATGCGDQFTINNQENDESITGIMQVTTNELKTMVKDGKIQNGITLSALTLFFTYLEDGK